MKKLKKVHLMCLLIILATSFFSTINILACECNIPSICAAYTRAKKVFVGKLEKVVKDELNSRNTIKAHFELV